MFLTALASGITEDKPRAKVCGQKKKKMKMKAVVPSEESEEDDEDSISEG